MSAGPEVAAIQRRVAARYGVRVTELRSLRRARAVTWPRHVAIHLCRALTPLSLPAIGREFGGRDHTTVAYACRQVEQRIAADPEEAARIATLADEIAAALPAPAPHDSREAVIVAMGRLLERRKGLAETRARLDGQIAEVDRRIEDLGRTAWGAGGATPAPEPAATPAPEPVPPKPEPEPEDADADMPEPLALAAPAHAACQWIEGEPGEHGRCDEPRAPGWPYCREHCGRAFASAEGKPFDLAHFDRPPRPPERRRRRAAR